MPKQLRPTYGSSITLRAVNAPVEASVEIPGSKSITNRALLLAAMASGTSLLRKPLYSDDTEHMMAALQALGARIEATAEDDLQVAGVGGKPHEPDEPLFIGNSGTSVRFLTAACTHLPARASCVLDGVARMRERPIQDLIDALVPLGGHVESLRANGCPPVRVHGGGLRGGETSVNGEISSQYLSALMMTAPLAKSDVTIRIRGKLVSKPYVAMTAQAMAAFGAHVDAAQRDGVLHVRAPQSYTGCDYLIEPDASNASYFLAAAAVTGGTVTIQNLGSASMQGDARFAELLQQTGCSVSIMEHSITVTGPSRLRAITADLTAMPDMAQTLAVICLFADGPSTIRGIHTLRVKETDRIAAIAAELTKLGARVEAGNDYWFIQPPSTTPKAQSIRTYDDHRMAMSFAVAGLRIDGLAIEDPGCVAKTFPDFWERWQAAFPNAHD